MYNFSREVDRQIFLCFYDWKSFVFNLWSTYGVSKEYNIATHCNVQCPLYYLELRRQKAGEGHIMWSFTTCTFHQIWKVATIILNKQSLAADKQSYSSLGDGRGGYNSSP
jgi:hypothetical protein